MAPKIEGGEIRIRTVLENGHLVIEVQDNGIGMSEARLARVYGEGIGMSNVRARLKLLYGEEFRFHITSRPGIGTQVRIEVPELVSLSPAIT